MRDLDKIVNVKASEGDNLVNAVDKFGAKEG
jgi:hypothetical protein